MNGQLSANCVASDSNQPTNDRQRPATAAARVGVPVEENLLERIFSRENFPPDYAQCELDDGTRNFDPVTIEPVECCISVSFFLDPVFILLWMCSTT